MLRRHRSHQPDIMPHSPDENARIGNRSGGKAFGRPFFDNEHGPLQRHGGWSSSLPKIGVVIEYGIFATTENGALGKRVCKISACLMRILVPFPIFFSIVPARAGSLSMASTCAAFSAAGKVMAPAPAPISNIVSVGRIWASSINSLITRLLINRCWAEKLAMPDFSRWEYLFLDTKKHLIHSD